MGARFSLGDSPSSCPAPERCLRLVGWGNGVQGAPGAPTSLMKSEMSEGLVGSTRGAWGCDRPNGASLRREGRPSGAPRAASSAGWRSWSMS